MLTQQTRRKKTRRAGSDVMIEFQIKATDPHSWLAEAIQLRIAADYLSAGLVAIRNRSQSERGIREQKLGFLKSHMLLSAFALENLLCAVAIATDPDVLSSPQSPDFRTWFATNKSHDLLSPTKRALGKLDRSTESLLKRLGAFGYWAGRYPVPKKAGTYVPSQLPTNLLSWTEEDTKTRDQLFKRLAAKIPTSTTAHTQPGRAGTKKGGRVIV